MINHQPPAWPTVGRSLTRWLFSAAVAAYLLLFLWEDLDPGVVSLHLNLSDLLWLAVISGVLSIWFDRGQPPAEFVRRRRDWWWLLVVSAVAGSIVYFRLANMGSLRWAIGGLTAIIIFMIGLMLADDNREDGDR